jgi:glucose/arabinose dehydrogenase
MSARMTKLTVGVLAVAGLLAGCAPEPVQQGTPAPVPSSTSTSTPGSTAVAEGPVQPVGEPTVVAEGLSAPWSVVRLDSGSSLISERDTGRVLELTDSGEVREVGIVPGVVAAGEGGLLGLAVPDGGALLYAYLTAASDNRIIRMPLGGDAGQLTLGAPEEVLTGIAKAGNHNGGRIAFGPDGMLYATTGDAGDRDAAQDPGSLNGKILRMTPDGVAPADNPDPATLVYSLGHRNPQGLAWDVDGRLWAAEFGQDTWDEFNAIEPGANYGWPIVEGVASDTRFVNPVYQWATDDASPSGLAYVRGTFFLAALKGETVWSIDAGDGVTVAPWFTGRYGRIRDAVPGPDGSLWMLTSNTDGRGSPQPGDDKLLQIQLETASPG